jgi:uncharacterized protein
MSQDMRNLEQVYREASARMDAWSKAQGFGCPHGCGRCCEGFVPDCLPVEAEYLAHYLLSEQPRVAERMAAPAEGPPPVRCPLYDPDSPFHCSVYAARPLVCRLFAFAGTRTKYGGWAFRLCRHMPAPAAWGPAREVGTETHPAPSRPPLMGEIQSAVAALRPGDEPLRRPLPDALREALGRILLRTFLARPTPSPRPPERS